METSTRNPTFVSPFFLTVLTNGLVTDNGLIYDFSNDGHNVAQQLQTCPLFMVQFDHLNRLENHRVFSSADLSKVHIITSSVTRNTSPKQNFSYNQIHLNAVSCSNLPYNERWPILALSATKPWIQNWQRKEGPNISPQTGENHCVDANGSSLI